MFFFQHTHGKSMLEQEVRFYIIAITITNSYISIVINLLVLLFQSPSVTCLTTHYNHHDNLYNHNHNQLHRLLYLPSYLVAGLLLLEMKAPHTW